MYKIGVYSIYSEEKVAHQDLKPDNILLDFNGVAYIGDFGNAKKLDTTIQTLTSAQGTLKWMSPEMRISFEEKKTRKIDFSKIDVFSLGLIFLFILDRPIFETNSELYNKDEKILKDYLDDFGNRFSSIDKDFLRILREILAFDPSKRMTIRELFTWMVNHFFISYF